MDKYDIHIEDYLNFGKIELTPTKESNPNQERTIYLIPTDMAKEISAKYIKKLEENRKQWETEQKK